MNSSARIYFMRLREFYYAPLTLAALTVFAFSETYFSSHDEFSTNDIILTLAVVFLVLGTQCALVAGIACRVRSMTSVIVLTSVFALLNFYCLYASLNVSFTELIPVYQTAFFGAGYFLIVTLLRAANENPRLRIWLACLPLLPAIFNGLGHWTTTSTEVTETNFGTATSSPNLRTVQFSTTPNVYLIAFDSLGPKSLVAKYMGLEPTELHLTLDEHFTGFTNVFAPHVPTKASLNATLALDEAYLVSEKLAEKRWELFQGMAPSPLFEIFKYNGYTTNTVYNTSYFGLGKGQYVDAYHINLKFTVCEFFDESSPTLVFFGLCKWQQTESWKRNLRKFGSEELSKRLGKMDYLISRIAAGLKTGKPQIFVSYIYLPGHTPRNYRNDDENMRATYIGKFARHSVITAREIRKLVSFVDENDPNAILLVFGDHGPWMSRNTPFKTDPAFYVTDRHGVYGGVHPKEICHETFIPIDGSRYTTTLHLVRQLITCLAEGKDPFVNEPKNELKVSNIGKLKYEEFLYE